MPVMYDTGSERFFIESGHCEYCHEPMYDTGCDAPGCTGYQCRECGAGCDIEVAPEDGRCAQALAEESGEEYTERVNAERAAFGLSPVQVDQVDASPAAGEE